MEAEVGLSSKSGQDRRRGICQQHPELGRPQENAAASNSGGIVKQAVKKNPIDKHVGSRVRMRRMMLGMSQSKLGDGLGITFQQVQKYEKGTNRMGASRLQHISHILQVPVPLFFEGAPHVPGQPKGNGEASSPAYVSEFLASTDGLALTKRSCG
jgi:transcriptional regulator with XRE-family HTH domain